MVYGHTYLGQESFYSEKSGLIFYGVQVLTVYNGCHPPTKLFITLKMNEMSPFSGSVMIQIDGFPNANLKFKTPNLNFWLDLQRKDGRT